VAKELNLRHQFSDPSRSVRRQLGVLQENDIRAIAFVKGWTGQQVVSQIGESHAIREQYWFDQLHLLDLFPLLFVCGANHTKSFSALLSDKGVEVVVPFSDWTPAKVNSNKIF
jgi:hypothetical protein